MKDSLGDGWCVLKSQDAQGLPCEQMPVNPRLTSVTGTDMSGATVTSCAVPAGVFCSAVTSTCSGGPFP